MKNTFENGFKLTENAGFDALRKKTWAISQNMGYNTADKIGLLKNHVLIKDMIKNKDIKINKIGMNICIFVRKNIFASKYVSVKKDFTLEKLVMNIARPICNVSGHDRFTLFNTNDIVIKRMFIDKNIYRQYNKIFQHCILFGDDIIPLEIFEKNTNNSYQKTLTNKEKRNKYNN